MPVPYTDFAVGDALSTTPAFSLKRGLDLGVRSDPEAGMARTAARNEPFCRALCETIRRARLVPWQMPFRRRLAPSDAGLKEIACNMSVYAPK